MLISQIVSVSINLQDAAVSRTSFGYPLILGDLKAAAAHGFPAAWGTRVKWYTGTAGLVADVYDQTKPIFKCATALMAQDPKPAGFYVGYYDSTAGAETPSQGLAQVALIDNAWYGALLIDRGSGKTTQQKSVADYVASSSRPKIAGFATNDTAMYTGPDVTSIGYQLSTGTGYNRSWTYYDQNASDGATDPLGYPDAAWMGAMFAGFAPGSATWAFKRPSGIAAAKDTVGAGAKDLSATQESEVLIGGTPDKCANLALTVGGVTATYWGTMGSGRFIDLQIGVDWLTTVMQERVYAKKVNLPKIAFTNEGIGIIEAELRGAFKEAIDAHFLSRLEYLTMPDEADVSASDKTARRLTGITFKAIAEGAVHTTAITGTITV
jgi:hypothetical protein